MKCVIEVVIGCTTAQVQTRNVDGHERKIWMQVDGCTAHGKPNSCHKGICGTWRSAVAVQCQYFLVRHNEYDVLPDSIIHAWENGYSTQCMSLLFRSWLVVQVAEMKRKKMLTLEFAGADPWRRWRLRATPLRASHLSDRIAGTKRNREGYRHGHGPYFRALVLGRAWTKLT